MLETVKLKTEALEKQISKPTEQRTWMANMFIYCSQMVAKSSANEVPPYS